MESSLVKMLEKHNKKNHISFSMPGHKNGRGIEKSLKNNFFGYDVTELADTESMHSPGKALTAALESTAEFFGSDESFILVFTVRNEAGALAQTLNIIGVHGFNMRSLRSRPMKDLLWNYYFYIEAEGNINTENGREMLQELSAVCAKLKLVGTYYSNNTRKEEN